MTSPMSAAEQQQRAEIQAAMTNYSRWATRASDLEDTAYQMRQLAERLRREVDSLGQPLVPVRALHTTATWEGNAATLSRQRLDTHEDRFQGATRAIDGIAASLSTEAQTTSQQATAARGEQDRYRRKAVAIELELGMYDHI